MKKPRTEFRVVLTIRSENPDGMRDGSWKNCIQELDETLKQHSFITPHEHLVDITQFELDGIVTE